MYNIQYTLKTYTRRCTAYICFSWWLGHTFAIYTCTLYIIWKCPFVNPYYNKNCVIHQFTTNKAISGRPENQNNTLHCVTCLAWCCVYAGKLQQSHNFPTENKTLCCITFYSDSEWQFANAVFIKWSNKYLCSLSILILFLKML